MSLKGVEGGMNNTGDVILGESGTVEMVQAKWGAIIEIGEHTKFRRPLNMVARSELGPVLGVALDLYDHFEARIRALEAAKLKAK